MNVDFTPSEWRDMSYWIENDKKMSEKVTKLIKDITRNKHTGLGHPEPLKGNLYGWWSRHIDD